MLNEVEDILRKGNLDALIGHREDLYLEAKSEPYDLGDPAGRYELAKDVSAFANAAGGHLIVGIVTERARDEDADILLTLKLLAPGKFPVDRYRSILKEHVFPSVDGMEVEFLEASGAGQGVGVIFVPPQHPDRGPFLISRVVEEGAYIKQVVAGYAERTGDRNEPLDPRSLQNRMKRGSDTLAERLGRIEDKLDTLLDQSTPATADEKVDHAQLDNRIASVLEAQE